MKEGYYWLNLSTINNSPFNGTGYVHVKTINGTPIQKAVGVSSGDIANRVKYDSGWTPWAQVAIKSDLSHVMKHAGTANLNANNAKNIGIYDVAQSNDSTNYPTKDGNGILVVFCAGPSIIAQIFFYYDGQMWSRAYWYGTWRSWFKASNNA